jgi:O-antigen/teichoic acid export membrane protein
VVETSQAVATAAGRPRTLRSLLADSVVFGFALAAAPVALVVATPIVARELGAAQLGVVDLLTALSTSLAVIALAGLDSAAARSYFDYDDTPRRVVVLRTALAAGLIAAAIFAALAMIAVLVFVAASARPIQRDYAVAGLIAFLLIPLANGQVLARARLLFERRRGPYVAAGLLHGLLGVAAAVAFVLAGAGPAGYFAGLCLGALASLAFSARAGRLLEPRTTWIDRPELRRMIRYGLPIVPGSLAIWAVFAIDRTLLASLRGVADAGYYGLASRVSAPLVLAVSAFAVAWGPFIIDQTPARRLDLRARALTMVSAGTGAGFVALVAFAEPLVRLAGGSEYVVNDAHHAVPGIALGWVGWGAATVLSAEFIVVRKTHVVAIATIAAAVANVGLNLVLIPPFGFVGAAWATAASFLLLAAIYWAWERRLAPAPYRPFRLVVVAGTLGVGSLVLIGWVDEKAWVERLVVALVAMVILGATAATDRTSADGGAR